MSNRGTYKRTPETLEKMRLNNLGVKNPAYGKPSSKNQKEAVRKASLGNKHRLGKAPYNKGTHLSGMLNKKHSEETKKQMSIVKKGRKLPWMIEEKHHAWKGGDVGYRALHNWVVRQLGQPRFCEDCGDRNLSHRQYHWANVSRTYKRIITDWRRLCARCHKAFDRSSL